MQTKEIRLYNTLTRTINPLQTLEPGRCKVYCCGPTVYDFQHIGNMRTYIFEDVLVRTLRKAGYNVNHIMNITDVGHLVSDADEGEDKMLVAAKREKKSSLEIAKYYTDVFFKDCKQLHITKPNTVCNATDHITEMIDLIKRLETNGMTYLAGGNVYFDVEKLPDYGKLAKLDLEKLKAGARIEVDSNKKSPFDFVLWFTKSKFENRELQWDSPWGRGYPGWHIECSAMSMKYLGKQFDIHCGGIDHISVHHTNEIAQSEGATKKPWVNVWMHGEFLLMNKEKMSKSKGGFVTLSTVVDKGVDPLAYRYLCLSAHYRSQLSFSDETLENAASGLKKLKSSILSIKAQNGNTALPAIPESDLISDFENAIFDDLNMPKAMASVWAAVNDNALKPGEKLSILNYMDDVLGFDINSWQEEVFDIPSDVSNLVAAREKARKEKNWSESDRLRNEIHNLDTR